MGIAQYGSFRKWWRLRRARNRLPRLFPLCSIYVFPVWALVLRVFTIHKLHRTTAGVGVASALIPLVLCCGLGGGLYALGIAIAVIAK